MVVTVQCTFLNGLKPLKSALELAIFFFPVGYVKFPLGHGRAHKVLKVQQERKTGRGAVW
ncbi:hypothetical protein B1A54_02085 [Corynebacterium diphtheriae]|nr:hypothetical protein A6J36_05710 [Corynebacterium diphtheriae]OSQ11705.1 hypothetical protein B1A57_09695 [Corynebacterium diphtheriae]OSQ19534.1 hypothetical protein B1A54_02085 [Corynebacterium diphtheriae]OWM44871.1 hypothetical protein BU164_00090 [Corynebacterium diphtheriae]OWM46889.1 hypothetical protein BU160_03350 [Corynebacterium diphtheriae]